MGFLHAEQIKTNSQRKLRELSNHYVKYLNIRLVYEVKYIHVNPLNAVPYVSVFVVNKKKLRNTEDRDFRSNLLQQGPEMIQTFLLSVLENVDEFLTYRNIAVKTYSKIPITVKLNGSLPRPFLAA